MFFVLKEVKADLEQYQLQKKIHTLKFPHEFWVEKKVLGGVLRRQLT